MTIVFQLTDEVAAAFPEAQVRLVTARGLRNDEPWDEVAAELERLERDVAGGAWRPLDETHPAIASWHEAYRAFGTNPRRNRPSVDALSRRLARGGRLPRISPAVDAYNLVSVRFGVPLGAFDLGALASPVHIRFARDGDRFTPLGEPEAVEGPNAGEVVYAQGAMVLTRHWNHRDADQTKVTERTRDAVFMVERVSEAAVPAGRLAEAQAALANLLKPHSDEVTLDLLDAGERVAALAAPGR